MDSSFSATIPSPPSPNEQPALPKINYYPPVVATLLAAVLLFLMLGLLALVGVANVATQIGRLNEGTPGASALGAGFCGIVAIACTVGAVYFALAVWKGISDLTTPLYFTRGTVAKKRDFDTRKANNWLAVEPSYVGPDTAVAAFVTDEQRAASVDRSQIFQPRFSTPRGRRKTPEDQELKRVLDSTEKPSGYLRPDRIAAKSDSPVVLQPEEPLKPRVVFRIDFASKQRFMLEEEVLVAHSARLQHIYYVARLRDGEWEPFRNKGLI